jgi:uncharacterized membrane protein
MNAEKSSHPNKKPAVHPFRAAVFRGLAVVLPPLLTIVIFLWVGGTIQHYVLEPVTAWTRNSLAWTIEDVRRKSEFPVSDAGTIVPVIEGVTYERLADGGYVPYDVYLWLENVERERNTGKGMPATGQEFYRRYAELRFLQPQFVIPFFLALFIFVLYLLGKFIAAGIGRMFWNLFEGGIHRVPLVRNVYSSVKQVSDFLLNERELEYSRVVAVEWPRKGIWSLGLMTGESLRDIEAAANEPVVSVLICTSPMPMTGFTITVRKSETVDLDITIDQAFQFIVSCGVVVPPHQMSKFRAPLKAPPRLVEADEADEASAEDRHAVGQ